MRIYQQHVLDIADDDNSFFAIEEGTGKLVGLAMATVMTEDLDDADYENRVKTLLLLFLYRMACYHF